MQANFFQLLKRKFSVYHRLLAVAILSISQIFAYGQNVGINSDGSLPNSSAMLDIKSKNKGLLIPRVALKGKTDVTTISSPEESLLVYNTTASGDGVNAVNAGFYYWNGKEWNSLSTSPGGGLNVNNNYWSLFGNSATDTSYFVGTNDNRPLSFRINNQPAGKLSPNGNTLWGLGSGASATTGWGITAIGVSALRQTTTQVSLVAVGDSALFNNGVGASSYLHAVQNTALGSKAAFSNTTGSYNTAVGSYALKANTTGDVNTALGSWALGANETGQSNTAVGAFAVGTNKTGSNNTGVGYGVLSFNTASGNTSVGYHSLEFNSSGYSNVAIGTEALNKSMDRSNLVAIGDSALYNNGYGASSFVHSIYNTAVGSKAAYSNTIGNALTAIGYHSLYSNINGAGSTAVGSDALTANTSGGLNTAVGSATMRANTLGGFNSAFGATALYQNTTGGHNTAVGYASLSSSNTSSDNTAVGFNALLSNIGGNGNVGVGANAMDNVTTGSNNTAIGTDADVSTGIVSNATAVGARAFAACSNCIVLGAVSGVNGANNNVNVGIGTTSPQQRLHVVGNIVATGSITSFSDVRFKTEITSLTNVLPLIENIHPIYYHWNKKDFPENQFTDARQLGFAAQEIEKYFPELVQTDSNGYKSVDYGRLTPVLLEAVKELQQQIDELKQQIQKTLQ